MGPSQGATNFGKHGVTFDEALTVFADPLTRLFDDEEHSSEERGEFAVGYSQAGRLLVVFRAGSRDSNFQCPRSHKERAA